MCRCVELSCCVGLFRCGGLRLGLGLGLSIALVARSKLHTSTVFYSKVPCLRYVLEASLPQ